MSAARQQSAMEYLITYGWAILIVAVVLASLYALGVFSFGNVTPKAQAGACYIYRPNGPRSQVQVGFAGICNNMPPQYVAQFNGWGSYISIPNSTSVENTNTITVAAWFYTKSSATQTLVDKYIGVACWSMTVSGGLVNWVVYDQNGNDQSLTANAVAATGVWHQAVVTRGDGNLTIYLDGRLVARQADTLGDMRTTSLIEIGTQLGAYHFNGSISNVQLYNESLSGAEILALYQEGIGGVPVTLSSLVAWWPLNGDANDYSGNNNYGTTSATSFNGTWVQSYSP